MEPNKDTPTWTCAELDNCARCGLRHTDLTFTKLTYPHDNWTHWASCPTNGEPIMLLFEGDIPG